jgi:hypothetical protein
VLGLNTEQMNKDHDYGGVIANQLATFDHLKLFTKPLPKKPAELPRIADHQDASQPLDARARAYLHSNCSHCHRKWGGGNAEFQLLVTLPVKELGILDVRPGHGEFGLREARLLSPGHPDRSLIHHRMTLLSLGRMPHVASNVVDEEAVKLIGDWIADQQATPAEPKESKELRLERAKLDADELAEILQISVYKFRYSGGPLHCWLEIEEDGKKNSDVSARDIRKGKEATNDGTILLWWRRGEIRLGLRSDGFSSSYLKGLPQEALWFGWKSAGSTGYTVQTSLTPSVGKTSTLLSYEFVEGKSDAKNPKAPRKITVALKAKFGDD